MSDVIFDPLNKFYKSRIGAIAENKNITFRVKGRFDRVDFKCCKDGEKPFYLPMEKKSGYFEVTASFSVGLYWYCFDLKDGRFIGYGDDFKGDLTFSPSYFQLSVYEKGYKVPKWLAGGIIYQIFPDRFFRSETAENCDVGRRKIHKDVHEDPVFMSNEMGEVTNDDFFGGNLNGITEKLLYIKSLGVTAVYLNPISKAFSNHRYDTGDFMNIDPLLGTEKDFEKLIAKAEQCGIKIILDGVFNHVGDDSVYFNKYGNYPSVGAYNDKNSEYYKWFKFIEYPDLYESWWGIKTLPAVDKSNRDYMNFICGENGVIAHYMKFGIKGYRLDVVDELPDEFVRKIRERIKSEDKNAVIIGEVWEDASNKISYGKRREYFLGKELDSVMNYPLKNAIINFVKSENPDELSDTIKTQTDHYPKIVLDCLMNILSTHDTARLLSAVGDADDLNAPKEIRASQFLKGEKRDNAIERLKAASLLQYTLYGVPSIYYGDETGMQGSFDPLNRRYFAWDAVDKDIFEWYKKLGEVRSNNKVFVSGRAKEFYRSKGFYSFKRTDGRNELLIAVNLSENRISFEFNGKLINLLDGKVYSEKISFGKNFLGIFKKYS